MSGYPPIPRDPSGAPLPVVWDDGLQSWKVYEGLMPLETKLAAIESKLLALDSKFADGSAKVALSGTAVTREVLLDAVSLAPLTRTNQINLNITNEKKVVLLVWNDLNTLQIRSSTPWENFAGSEPHWGSLYPSAANFDTTPSHNPHIFVWVGMQWVRLGLTDIKEAFDIALPPVSPSFIRVHNNDPDETLTITIHILRYWR